MCLLEQWNRLGGLARAKKTYSLHLHCFEIFWVLSNCFREGCSGFDHLVLLIEDHPSEILDTRGFGLFRCQGIQFPQRFIEVAGFS